MSGSSRKPLSNRDFALRRSEHTQPPVYYPTGIGPPKSTHSQIHSHYQNYPNVPAMSSVGQRSQVDELKYLNNIHDTGYSANTVCEPGQIPAQDYLRAFPPTPEHSRDHSYPFKYSDEYPNDFRKTPGYGNIVRRKKLWVSSFKRNNASDPVENFAVNLEEGTFKNIRAVRIINIQCVYLTDAVPIVNGFVQLPDLQDNEVTSDGFSYHCYFPIVTGAAGTTVRFNYVPNDYLTTFKKLDIIKNKLRVKVFAENSTTGDIELFEDLISFALELEFMQTESDRRGLEDYPPLT